MNRYIDADALAYIVASNGDADFINKVTRLMIEAPSIDIVRCCECYHFDNDSCYCTIFHALMDDLGFCYVGDRKTEKDERRAYVKGADDD